MKYFLHFLLKLLDEVFSSYFLHFLCFKLCNLGFEGLATFGGRYHVGAPVVVFPSLRII